MLNEAYFRSKGVKLKELWSIKRFLAKKFSLSRQQWNLICDYLERRKAEANEEVFFGVVFAITQYCNLNCVHCAANAKLSGRNRTIPFQLTTDQVLTIIDKIERYTKKTGFQSFLCFGGGEPTLRPDFAQVVAYASAKLGIGNVGFSTNGTLLDIESVRQLGKHVGVIEVSLDGFEDKHNQIRDPNKVTGIINPFDQTVNLISHMVRDKSLKHKLEVSSVAMKRNIHTIPSLARWLRELGVKNYSIHRAMPIGRMVERNEDIPNSFDYLSLLVQISKVHQEDSAFKIHMHHSLESIYSTLFIGKDIHETDLPMGSGKHSIGIDWNGFVYFDPWSLLRPFNMLQAGNLLDENKDIEDFMDEPQGIMKLSQEIIKRNVRCKQCKILCTGGMRFNAIAHYVSQFERKSISKSHLIAGFSEIDPACPLYG